LEDECPERGYFLVELSLDRFLWTEYFAPFFQKVRRSEFCFYLNGFGPNGFSLDGLGLDGFSLNGFSLNGLGSNGFSLDGLGLDGFSLNGFGSS
jgi:hypothetical protein